MFLKRGAVDTVQRNKRIKAEFERLNRDFFESIQPLEYDLEDYHLISFQKFAYELHRTLSALMKVDEVYTNKELIDFINNLPTFNYEIAKEIKQIEQQMVTDKDHFFELKEKLAQLDYKKNYFSTIEKNAIRKSTLFEISDFLKKIEHLEYSGKLITKEQVGEAFEEGKHHIADLTSTELIDEHKSLPEKAMDGLKAVFSHAQEKFLSPRVKPVEPQEARLAPSESNPIPQKNKDTLESQWIRADEARQSAPTEAGQARVAEDNSQALGEDTQEQTQQTETAYTVKDSVDGQEGAHDTEIKDTQTSPEESGPQPHGTTSTEGSQEPPVQNETVKDTTQNSEDSKETQSIVEAQEAPQEKTEVAEIMQRPEDSTPHAEDTQTRPEERKPQTPEPSTEGMQADASSQEEGAPDETPERVPATETLDKEQELSEAPEVQEKMAGDYVEEHVEWAPTEEDICDSLEKGQTEPEHTTQSDTTEQSTVSAQVEPRNETQATAPEVKQESIEDARAGEANKETQPVDDESQGEPDQPEQPVQIHDAEARTETHEDSSTMDTGNEIPVEPEVQGEPEIEEPQPPMEMQNAAAQ
ncbi:MAG: hypothetical protein ACQESG_07625, partial [Nanobdellota archaeon]